MLGVQTASLPKIATQPEAVLGRELAFAALLGPHSMCLVCTASLKRNAKAVEWALVLDQVLASFRGETILSFGCEFLAAPMKGGGGAVMEPGPPPCTRAFSHS